jgi:hypothetical protein
MAQGRLLPCADYAAVPELKATTEKHCPRSSSQFGENSPSKSPKSRHPSLRSSPQTSPRATHVNLTPPAFLLPPPVQPPPSKLDHTARFSCSRASPLVCVNQSLCSTLDLLRRSRALESNERSALSYARAIAVSLTLPRLVCFLTVYVRQVIKGACVCIVYPTPTLLTGYSAFPRKITARERREVQKLPFIGSKVSKMVR